VVAVGPKGAKVAADKLQMVVNERRYVSSLVRLENGTFATNRCAKDVEILAQTLRAAGHRHARQAAQRTRQATSRSRCRTRPAKSCRRSLLPWLVSAIWRARWRRTPSCNSRSRPAMSRLVAKSKCRSKAPYAGSGLITVEREKVYAWKWFHMGETASVQKIKVPAELEGGGYVSVSFVRDSASEEVFMSPLSYATVPFVISRGSAP